ncbi:MAG: DegT/DnrJ/EryC1/StrS family aminotransferase, partial [Clostridia bacterium]|nr:DegT/DnrJ/EryC1/StrS family aminotransferase [Clostridia bacterium]
YIECEEVTPADVVIKLQNAEIEARPAWKPMHMQPVFEGTKAFSHYDDAFVDEDVFAHAVCLPSGDSMTNDQLQLVVDEVRKCFA